MKNIINRNKNFILIVLTIIFLATVSASFIFSVNSRALAAEDSGYYILVVNNEFTCAATKVDDIEDARLYVKQEISALGITEEYEIRNEEFVAPQVGAKGEYAFGVKFASARKVVDCKLVIDAVTDPIVLDFSNPAHVSALNGNSAVKRTVENGKLKMVCTDVESQNFYLQFDFASITDRPLYGEELSFLKIKYKTSMVKTTASMEFFYYRQDGKADLREFSVDNGSIEGNEITLIIDISVADKQTDSIWVFDDTLSTVSTKKYSSAGYVDKGGETNSFEGQITGFRFNFAYDKDYARTTVVDYMGFFSSYDAAKEFEQTPSDFESVAQSLTNQKLESRWGDAYDEASAVKQAAVAVGNKFGLDCSVINYVYIPATTEQKGSLAFDAVFKNAGKTEVVSGICMEILKKPNDYQMLDMTDENLVSKFYPGDITTSFEDGYFKMVQNDWQADDNFYFYVDCGSKEEVENGTADIEEFYFQDYSYLVTRYKREGIAGGQVYYWMQDGNPEAPLLNEFYLGQTPGHWYTSIVCSNVRDYDVPFVINYDETAGVVESARLLYAYSLNPEIKGTVEKIRFTYARKRFLNRTAWIDYIAFFPTLEEAQAYFAKDMMDGYKGETLSYYQGDSQQVAEESIKDLLNVKIGKKGYDVILSQIQYIKPESNVSDGLIKCVAEFKDKDGNTVVTSEQMTFEINNEVDKSKSTFVFSNPYFIREVEGSSPTSTNFTAMQLNGYKSKFTFELPDFRKFVVREKQYVSFKVDAVSSGLKFSVNGVDYQIDHQFNGEESVVLDILSGDYYINSTKVGTSEFKKITKGELSSFGMKFECDTAKVYHVAFFGDLNDAKAYVGELSSTEMLEIVNAIQSINLEERYSRANTQLKATKCAQIAIRDALPDDYEFYDLEVVSYTPSTETEKGSVKVKAYFYKGDNYSSEFAQAELTVKIGLKTALSSNLTNGNVVISEGDGHLFSGNDWIVTKAALGDASTFEWKMIADSNISSGLYRLFSSVDGKFIISIKNGEIIYQNGDVVIQTEGLSVCDGESRHFAIVAGEKIVIYVNGVKFGEYEYADDLRLLETVGLLNIGKISADKEGKGFIGRIADVAVYSTEKSPEEIANHAVTYLSDTTSLIAAWSLDKQIYLNNKYPGAITLNERGYYANSHGYEDMSSFGNYGVFYSDGWYNLENIITDYTMIQISDTQSYDFYDQDKDGVMDYKLLDTMYGWMSDNKDKLNIVMVNNLGDVTQEATKEEWGFTKSAVKDTLEKNNLPYNIALGNHDYHDPYTMIGAIYRYTENYESVFTMEDMIKQYENADYVRFGGTFSGNDMVNNYILFEAGDPAVNYIVITLEFGPREEVINWANELLTKYSDHEAIILTHSYYTMYGDKKIDNQFGGEDFADAYSGIDIWNELINKHDNVAMVNCGHSQNNTVQAYVDATDSGHNVVQILSDPSAMISAFPSVQGLIELMCFTNDGTMHTYYYSPVKGMFYDTQFECTFDMDFND